MSAQLALQVLLPEILLVNYLGGLPKQARTDPTQCTEIDLNVTCVSCVVYGLSLVNSSLAVIIRYECTKLIMEVLCVR